MLNKATLIDTGSFVNLASERRRISGRRFPGWKGATTGNTFAFTG